MIWRGNYNIVMGLGGALCSCTVALAAFGCVTFAPRPATAQQLVTQTSTRAAPLLDDAPKVNAAAQPATAEAIPPHAFWDRTNIALFSGVAVTRAFDYASTRNFQARGREEILLPDDVVNNSAGFASLEAAATLTNIGMAYLLHRTGHHKLERWLSIGHISVTGFGDVRNYCLESKHNP